jgi:hypothetical protein
MTMTARRIVFWCVLVPITIAVWAKVVLPPCVFGCAKIQAQIQEPPPAPKLYKSMVICPVVSPCWRDGVPIVGAL